MSHARGGQEMDILMEDEKKEAERLLKLSQLPEIQKMELLKEVSADKRPELFIRKLRMCTRLCNFTDTTADEDKKEIKRAALLELVEHTNTRAVFNEQNIEIVVEMICANIFRPMLPPSSLHRSFTPSHYDPDDEDPRLEPSWPHLQIVYELMSRFIASSEVEVRFAKKYFDTPFITKLLHLFDSEDPNERDVLKTLLHRIYGKFMAMRVLIRKEINNILYSFIYETERFNGASELLEILGSIINGFALPLKEEHKYFLEHYLLPLHKVKCLPQYHQQLTYCITQYMGKDASLALVVFNALVKFWPQASSPKEVIFLSELEEVLEIMPVVELQGIKLKIINLLQRCIASSHYQVAERSLMLWNNDKLSNFILANRETVLPIVIPVLHNFVHWNTTITSLALAVQRLFMDADPVFYQKCAAELLVTGGIIKMRQARLEQQEQRWSRLDNMLKNRRPGKGGLAIPAGVSGLSPRGQSGNRASPVATLSAKPRSSTPPVSALAKSTVGPIKNVARDSSLSSPSAPVMKPVAKKPVAAPVKVIPTPKKK